jgi:hypothetical protein
MVLIGCRIGPACAMSSIRLKIRLLQGHNKLKIDFAKSEQGLAANTVSISQRSIVNIEVIWNTFKQI